MKAGLDLWLGKLCVQSKTDTKSVLEFMHCALH